MPFGFQHKRHKTQNDTTELTAKQEMRRKLYVFQQNIDQLKDISGNILKNFMINNFNHLCFYLLDEDKQFIYNYHKDLIELEKFQNFHSVKTILYNGFRGTF